jgi:hypothetical protein
MVGTPHGPAFTAAPAARPAPPVPRVVRKDAAPPGGEQGSAPPDNGKGPGTAFPSPRPIPWSGASPAGADLFDSAGIQRLADQVVQVIDNRITANRERMGRI